MRLNQFIARSTGCSRRQADRLIDQGKVTINGQLASVGQQVTGSDQVALDGRMLEASQHRTIILHKPVGYVVSREGQGSRTIYDLLPAEMHDLKPVGRLDKDSSGLLLLTNDGQLANQLTHPRYKKFKLYRVELDKSLSEVSSKKLREGVELSDGPSHLKINQIKGPSLVVELAEGRKRQIRRTFAEIGYTVTALHRTQFGPYSLDDLQAGQWRVLDSNSADVGSAAQLVERGDAG